MSSMKGVPMKWPSVVATLLSIAVGLGQITSSDTFGMNRKGLDANPNNSLAHYRIGSIFFEQKNYQAAANEFRTALNGDLDPKSTEVWSHIALGRIFDITGQRERANAFQWLECDT